MHDSLLMRDDTEPEYSEPQHPCPHCDVPIPVHRSVVAGVYLCPECERNFAFRWHWGRAHFEKMEER